MSKRAPDHPEPGARWSRRGPPAARWAREHALDRAGIVDRREQPTPSGTVGTPQNVREEHPPQQVCPGVGRATATPAGWPCGTYLVRRRAPASTPTAPTAPTSSCPKGYAASTRPSGPTCWARCLSSARGRCACRTRGKRGHVRSSSVFADTHPLTAAVAVQRVGAKLLGAVCHRPPPFAGFPCSASAASSLLRQAAASVSLPLAS
jgi:hypothetical protein